MKNRTEQRSDHYIPVPDTKLAGLRKDIYGGVALYCITVSLLGHDLVCVDRHLDWACNIRSLQKDYTCWSVSRGARGQGLRRWFTTISSGLSKCREVEVATMLFRDS